ncbi:TPA: type IV toxin-antitoxin system AbiEi family antitoxin domain-containing protein [Vibrio harveyi]|nr:type IV toxin-antitoxin system AbiEi family antitoxin domain-containing protein [Vibrio harveyi]
MTTLNRIEVYIKASRRHVFERKDFAHFASDSQISRSLKRLIEKGILMRVGYGLYTKATINSLTNHPMPTHPGGTDGVMLEILKKLGVPFEVDQMSLKSINGHSNQIPASVQYSWDHKAFNREIKLGNRVLYSAQKRSDD